ncbi:AAA family ATPase [SAR202 cluster bacterium AD-804-J14_MRT_500m]|nr:AAA family ATPase [SAR202 cluster bacterium AD-804-J14_MRT_500m]
MNIVGQNDRSSYTTQLGIQDDLELLLQCLPPRVVNPLKQRDDLNNLLEVVLDLARPPEARFSTGDVIIDESSVSDIDIDFVTSSVSEFGEDNRSGIERTLHRISAIRNRKGRILGITCRVGRAVFGTIQIIEDLILSGKSVLLLGRPGVGKTTMLREVARVLADTAKKRVIVVDTSNEIAGDGDIPHPGIGHARRMQVASPILQHAVMIEAVENHMPEVIIIDEMGTELEASAARTIAERGVQLIATAHGNTLDNLIINPTLSDLVGGVQTVTLGDDEARIRGTRKTVLERKAPPTFGVVVEIQSWDKVAVHDDVAQVVDSWLRGYPLMPEIRSLDDEGNSVRSRKMVSSRDIRTDVKSISRTEQYAGDDIPTAGARKPQVFLFGVGRDRLEQAVNDAGVKVDIVNELRSADLVLTTKSHYRRGSRVVQIAEETGTPVYVVRKNSVPQIQQFLRGVLNRPDEDRTMDSSLQEAHLAAQRILDGEGQVDLPPQRAYVRRLQHLLAKKYNVISDSNGLEPYRYVRFTRGQ